jgi:magnesium transporter
MIRGAKYSGGKVKAVSIKSSNILRETVWIDVVTKDKKELKELHKKFNLYSRDLEDSIDMHEVPRLANRKDYSFIVLRSLTGKNQSIPLGVFLSKKFIITIHPKEIKPLSSLFKIVHTKEGKEFFGRGLDFLFYKIVSEINRNLHGDLEKFDDKIDKMEEKVLNNKMERANELFPLKKHLTYYKKVLTSNKGIIEKLQNKTSKFTSEKNFLDLNSLHVEIAQAENTVEFQREKLTGISEMYMSSISNRLNDAMRSFTVLASVLLLPMLISGIWGMNFAKIPFFDSPYGFYIPLVLMVLSVVILFAFFKRKKWV